MTDNNKSTLDNTPGGKAGFIIFNIVVIMLIVWGCSDSPKLTMSDVAGQYKTGAIVNGEEVINQSMSVDLGSNGKGILSENGRTYSVSWRLMSPEKESGERAVIEVIQHSASGNAEYILQVGDDVLYLNTNFK